MSQRWEIRSVNGKRLDLKWSLPAEVRSLESRLEKVVKRYATRGRIEISLDMQLAEGAGASRFDAQRASGMLDALETLARERGEEFVPDHNALLAIPFLWGGGDDDLDETMVEELEQGLSVALEDWNEARATEGQALSRDLLSRVLRMEQWTEVIGQSVPSIKQARVDALRSRIEEQMDALGLGAIEESRFLQEVVLLMDRLDVTEELTRLATHLDRLQELLREDSDVGRRLDFTLQECFREINTCGNKIPDVQLSRLVVDFKNELEKCREQAQNME